MRQKILQKYSRLTSLGLALFSFGFGFTVLACPEDQMKQLKELSTHLELRLTQNKSTELYLSKNGCHLLAYTVNTDQTPHSSQFVFYDFSRGGLSFFPRENGINLYQGKADTTIFISSPSFSESKLIQEQLQTINTICINLKKIPSCTEHQAGLPPIFSDSGNHRFETRKKLQENETRSDPIAKDLNQLINIVTETLTIHPLSSSSCHANLNLFEMDPFYTDEHQEGILGAKLDQPNKKKTLYMDEQQRQEFEISVNANGLLVKQTGELLNGPSFIFVMDPTGKLYAQAKDPAASDAFSSEYSLHHSSFLSGKTVLSAGDLLHVKNGIIQGISNKSGHYKPTRHSIAQVLAVLKSKGYKSAEKMDYYVIEAPEQTPGIHP